MAGDIRPAAECAGTTVLAWNAPETGRDSVQTGVTMGVVACDDNATMHKAPREDDEASFDAATGATEWGDAGTTAACDAAAATQDAAPAGFDGMAARYGGRGCERGRGGASIAAMLALYDHHGNA